MTEPYNNLIYDTHSALLQYVETALQAKNQFALFKLASKRRQELPYGDPARCEALQKQAEFDCLETGQQENIEAALRQQSRHGEAAQQTLKLLQQFKATLKLDIQNEEALLAQIQSRVNAYEPTLDNQATTDDRTLSEMEESLEQQKRDYIVALEKIYDSYVIKPGLTVNRAQRPNAVAHNQSMDVRLVYADDTQQAVVHGQVIYWEYPAGQDRLDSSDINNLTLCLAETDQRGFINRSAAYPDDIEQQQGWHRGYIVTDNKITIASVAGAGVLPSVSPVLTNAAQVKLRKFAHDRMQARFPSTSYAAKKYDYRPDDLGDELKQAITQHGRRFSTPIKFRPGRTYGFFVCPLQFGHLQTIDLNELIKLKIGDSSVVTVQKLPESHEQYVQVVAHSTLREWNRRLMCLSKQLTRLLDTKKTEILAHNKNLCSLQVLSQLSHWHRFNKNEPQNPIQQGLNDKLNDVLKSISSEYQTVISSDAEPIQLAASACADQIIALLGNEYFALEMRDHLRFVKDHFEENPIAGPYMQSDPGWFNIFETIDHSLIALFCSERSVLAFDTIGKPFLQLMLNADEEGYLADEGITEVNLTVASDRQGVSAAEISDRRRFFATTYEKLKVDAEPLILEYLTEFAYKKNGQPLIAMLNTLPGPNSILQSIVFSTGHLAQFFYETVPDGVSNKHAMLRRVGLSMMRRLFSFSSKGQDGASKIFHEFEGVFDLYLTNPKGHNTNGTYAEQVIQKITENTDISGAFWYRSLCQVAGILSSATELWRSLNNYQKNQHDIDAGQVFLQVVLPSTLNFAYVGSNSAVLAMKMRRDSLLNKRLCESVIQGLLKTEQRIDDITRLSGKLGHLIGIYSTIINIKLSVEHYGLGNPAKGAEYLFEALSIIAVSYGPLMGFASPIIVAIGVIITIALFVYRLLSHSDLHELIKLYQDGLEPLWLQPGGRDLRPWSLRSHMQQAAILIDQIQWQELDWTTIIPLYELGLPPATIATLAISDARYEYEGAVGLRKNIRNINDVINYYQRLQAAVTQGLEPSEEKQQIFKQTLRRLNSASPGTRDYLQLPDFLEIMYEHRYESAPQNNQAIAPKTGNQTL